tara:strand:+ start:67 stop:441 length:375 start_codon:yes stop_codon:yes gene_type:complete
MKKKLLLLIIFSTLLSCNTEKEKAPIEKKIWVYLEIEKKGEELEDAIYGEITKNDIKLFQDNSKSEKLFMIINTRYNDATDSIIKDLSENSIDNGTYFYRIKNINYLKIIKNDPINTKVDLQQE